MPWELTGNAGTNPANAFLGTTDNQPLAIRTNNVERIRVTPQGNVGIGTTNPITDVPGGRALHIDNPTGASALRLGDGAANGMQWEWQSTVIGNEGAMNLSNMTPPLFLGAYHTVLTVLQDGKVGIGQTQPTQKLTLGSGNIGLPNADRGFNGNLYFGGITDAGQTGLRIFGGLVNGAIPAGFIDVRTTDPNDGLRIRVDTGDGGTERMRITAGGTVAVNEDLEVNRNLLVSGGAGGEATIDVVTKIGVYTQVSPPNLAVLPARLHVDQQFAQFTPIAIHSGGSAAGYSFASQDYEDFRWDGTDGQRWELFAASDRDSNRWGGGGGTYSSSVRLWTYGGDRLFVTFGGELVLGGNYGLVQQGGPGTPWSDRSVSYPEIPIGTLTRPVPDPPNSWAPASGELVLGGIRTSIRGFDGAVDDPTNPLGVPGLSVGAHWIRTNGHESELWMGFIRLKPPGTQPLGTQPLLRALQAAVPWTAPAYGTSSDARLKTNIRQIEGALDKLERFRGVAFEWAKAESPYALGSVPGQSSLGVIAQEVEEVFPELVYRYDPDQEYRAVDYDGLTSVLIEAVKELKAQNKALRSRIEALERA